MQPVPRRVEAPASGVTVAAGAPQPATRKADSPDPDKRMQMRACPPPARGASLVEQTSGSPLRARIFLVRMWNFSQLAGDQKPLHPPDTPNIQPWTPGTGARQRSGVADGAEALRSTRKTQNRARPSTKKKETHQRTGDRTVKTLVQ